MNVNLAQNSKKALFILQRAFYFYGKYFFVRLFIQARLNELTGFFNILSDGFR